MATDYLRTRLSALPPEKVEELCAVVERRPETIEAWREGRTIPIRSVWPKISQFLGEPRGAMFEAAAVERVDATR